MKKEIKEKKNKSQLYNGFYLSPSNTFNYLVFSQMKIKPDSQDSLLLIKP